MNDLLNTRQAAVIIGVNDSRVRQLCRSGELTAFRLGRDWCIPRRSAEQFQRKTPGPQKTA
jgi:excisionase family DNA binding protein